MDDQRADVLAPLAQGGDVNRIDIQAVEEIEPEPPGLDGLLQVHVRGGDDAHVGLDDLIPADARELAILKHAQELDLRARTQLADLIQKERAAVGLLELPDATRAGVGEGPALMPEQLRLQQGLRQRAAVDLDERLIGATAVVMNEVGDQLLPHAGFSLQEHGRRAIGHVQGHLDAPLDLVAHADDGERGLRSAQLLAQAHDFGAQLILLQSQRDLVRDPLDQPRLVDGQAHRRRAPGEQERAEGAVFDQNGDDERQLRAAEDFIQERAGGIPLGRCHAGGAFFGEGPLQDRILFDEDLRGRDGLSGSPSHRIPAQSHARRIEHGQAAQIGAHQLHGAIHDQGRDLQEIAAPVDLIGDLQKRAVDGGLFLLLHIEPRVLIADGDLSRDGLDEADLLRQPPMRTPAVVEADQAQDLRLAHHGDDQQRARRRQLHDPRQHGVQAQRGRVIYGDRSREIQPLLQGLKIHRDLHPQHRGDALVGAIFVGDLQLPTLRARDQMAPIHFHQLPQLLGGRAQEGVQVNELTRLGVQAVNDGIARLIHAQALLQRQSAGFGGLRHTRLLLQTSGGASATRRVREEALDSRSCSPCVEPKV
ncbi:hypothetical protein HRbin10_02071 [bacterium HR10]|nr:hypothetical protein HRbin10_02071 [bacterium HR10]